MYGACGLALAFNVAVYAFLYRATMDDLSALNSTYSNKSVFGPAADYVNYFGLFSLGLLGIFADKISARFALNLTNLATAALYLSAFLLANKSRFPHLKDATTVLVWVLKSSVIFQHTNYAAQATEAIRVGTLSAPGGPMLGTSMLMGIVRLGASYLIGAASSTVLAPKIRATAFPGTDFLAFAAGLTFFCMVANLLMDFPTATVPAKTATGLRPVLAPGVKRGFFTVLARGLPLLVLVAVARTARSMVVLTSKNIAESPKGFWSDLPVSSDFIAGFTANLCVLPSLMLFCRGPGTVLAVLCVALVAFRSWMLVTPDVVKENSGEVALVLTIFATVLYNVPTTVVAVASEQGTKGRMIAFTTIIGSLLYAFGPKQEKPLLDVARTALAGAFPKIPLSDDVVRAVVLIVFAVYMIVTLPTLSQSKAVVAPEKTAVVQSSSSAEQQKRTVAAAAAAPTLNRQGSTDRKKTGKK